MITASILRFVMLLTLVIWVGGIIFFSFVLAPTLFSTLAGIENGRHLAGAVVSRSLFILHAAGLACGVIFALCLFLYSNALKGSVKIGGAKPGLIFAMLLLTSFSQFAIAPRMAALRSRMGVIDAVGADDPRRIEFNQWHRWSTLAEGGVLLSGLVLLFLVSKDIR